MKRSVVNASRADILTACTAQAQPCMPCLGTAEADGWRRPLTRYDRVRGKGEEAKAQDHRPSSQRGHRLCGAANLAGCTTTSLVLWRQKCPNQLQLSRTAGTGVRKAGGACLVAGLLAADAVPELMQPHRCQSETTDLCQLASLVMLLNSRRGLRLAAARSGSSRTGNMAPTAVHGA